MDDSNAGIEHVNHAGGQQHVRIDLRLLEGLCAAGETCQIAEEAGQQAGAREVAQLERGAKLVLHVEHNLKYNKPIGI